MVRVLPEPETGKDRIAPVDGTVAVAALLCLVKLSKGKEALSLLTLRRRWLRREVAEQLLPVINCSVAVAVKGEPRII